MVTAAARYAPALIAFLLLTDVGGISAQSPSELKDSVAPIGSQPNTLDEAFRELDRRLSAKEKEDIKRKPEIHAAADADFRLVVFIRRWFNSEHAPLRDDLQIRGLQHLDHAYVLLGAYWQHLNGKPIEIGKCLVGGPNTLEEAFQELDQLLPLEQIPITRNHILRR